MESSAGVRSAIESKWRGAKGETAGVDGVEEAYVLFEDLESWESCCRARRAGRRELVAGIFLGRRLC